ncbi:isochorismatase family protein [Chloroflexota bacterium]
MEKENYFTKSTIDLVAFEMLNYLDNQDLIRHSQRFDLSSSALLILDMQNYFLSDNSHAYIPSAQAIIPKILTLILEFQLENRPIILSQHVNDIDYSGMMEVWWNDLIKPGTKQAQIVDNFKIEQGIILVKEYYDAFYKSELDKILQESSVSNLVICGVMTHLCCETTARAAFMHNYKVFFTIDGTATYNRKFHEATLLNLAHGFSRPVLCSELIGT